MKVKIHNAVSSVTVNAKPSDFVATLKRKYIEGEGFVGSASAVDLVFRGQRLDDVKQLSAYGIEDGAVLAHVSSAGVAPAVDYARVSSLLQEAHKASLSGAQDPGDYTPGTSSHGADWSPHWARGSEWQAFPAVLVGSTIPREDVIDEGGEDTDTGSFEDLLERLHGPMEGTSAASGLVKSSGGDASTSAGAAAAFTAPVDHAMNGGGGPTKYAKTDNASDGSEVSVNGSLEGSFSGQSGGGDSGGHVHHTSTQRRRATAGESVDGAMRTESTVMTTSDAQREKDRSLIRAMLTRMRAARRSRQALVTRATEKMVAFEDQQKHKIHIPGPSRIFRNIYIAQVGRFAFRLLHRMEGRWSGEAEVHIPGHVVALPDVRAVAVSLSFEDASGCWRERQSLTTQDGLVSSQYMSLRPIADGTCRIELTDEFGLERRVPQHMHSSHGGHHHVGGQAQGGGARTGSSSSSSFSSSTSPRLTGQSMPSSAAAAAGTSPESFIAGANFNLGAGGSGGSEGAGTGWSGFAPASTYEMTLSEHGDTMLVLTATSRNTGRHVIIETITCVSDMVRVRTVQRFDESGSQLECFCLIREQRVIDAVTGAMDRYPRGYRT